MVQSSKVKGSCPYWVNSVHSLEIHLDSLLRLNSQKEVHISSTSSHLQQAKRLWPILMNRPDLSYLCLVTSYLDSSNVIHLDVKPLVHSRLIYTRCCHHKKL